MMTTGDACIAKFRNKLMTILRTIVRSYVWLVIGVIVVRGDGDAYNNTSVEK